MTLELHGTLSRQGIVQGDCVWCEKSTDSTFWAPNLGRDLPLHVLCSMRLIRAYERILAGHLLPVEEREAIGRLLQGGPAIRVKEQIDDRVRELLALPEGEVIEYVPVRERAVDRVRMGLVLEAKVERLRERAALRLMPPEVIGRRWIERMARRRGWEVLGPGEVAMSDAHAYYFLRNRVAVRVAIPVERRSVDHRVPSDG